MFDTIRGLWLREDALHAVDFAYLEGTLYFLDGSSKRVRMMGQDNSEEGHVSWSATLCRMDETLDFLLGQIEKDMTKIKDSVEAQGKTVATLQTSLVSALQLMGQQYDELNARVTALEQQT